MIRSVAIASIAALLLACGDSSDGGLGSSEPLPDTPEEIEGLGQECVNLLWSGRFEQAAAVCERASRAAPDDAEMAAFAEDARAALQGSHDEEE